MQLRPAFLALIGFGGGVWGGTSRRGVRSVFSVAAIFAITTLGPARMTSVAWADEDPLEEETVTSVTISVLGWECTPIIQNGVIKGIFAQITPEIAVEGNLETVWFEQDETGDWVSSSWSGSGTASNALGWIRGHFAEVAIFDAIPNLQTQSPEPVFDEETQMFDGNWLAPTTLDGGLLEDDPLQLFLGDAPRTPEMFEMMSNNGWPVAPELSPLCSHHGGDCETSSEEITLQEFLDALAAKIQSTMPGTTTIVGDMDASQYPMPDGWCSCTNSTSVKCGIVVRNTGTNSQGYWKYKDKSCVTHHRKSGDYPISCWSCINEWDDPATITPDPNPVWYSPFTGAP